MGRSSRVKAGFAAVGLFVPLSLASCSSGTTSTGGGNATTTTAAGTPVNAGATVSITEFAYGPKEVKVKKGQTVTWKNDGAAKHTVTSDDKTLESPNLNAAPSTDVYVKTFDTPGTYEYFCSVHTKAKMSGTVIVE